MSRGYRLRLLCFKQLGQRNSHNVSAAVVATVFFGEVRG